MQITKIRAKLDKRYNTDLTVKLVDMGFTPTTYHRLRRAGIGVVGDLVSMSWRELSGRRNVTRATCQEVSDKLDDMGLGLRKEGVK